jgi:hypothetical protein
MAYIPKDSERYVAEIVEEIRVEGDLRNVIHRNLLLINAHSPDEAYARAVGLGKEGETEYENPAGKNVVIKFRGLAALSVIHDKLEHGAELRYSEDIGVSETKIAELVRAKEQLSVFRDIEASNGPDYACKEIVDEGLELMARHREEG